MSFTDYANKVKSGRDAIKVAVNNKGQSAPDNVKLGDLPKYIDAIVVSKGATAKIVVTATDYEGQTITATKGSSKVTGVVKSGKCELEVSESGTWTISTSDGTTAQVDVVLDYTAELSQPVLGFRVTQSESDPEKRIVYTDGATGFTPVTVDSSTGKANWGSWKDTWLVKKFYPVMLKTNGTIDYKLDPDDLSKRAGGGTSDVDNTSYDGNAMVCIEKFYTKLTTSGGYEYIQFSAKKADGFEALGFKRSDGSEMDRVFISCYQCLNQSNKLKSYSGVTPSKTGYSTFLTYTTNINANYGMFTYVHFQLFNLIANLLFKREDVLNQIGKGRTGAQTTGLTNDVGGIGINKSSTANQFLWLEDFVCSFYNPVLQGVLRNGSTTYIKLTKPYSFTNTSGYTLVSGAIANTSSLENIKCSIANNTYMRYPTTGGATSTTYECSAVNYYNTASVAPARRTLSVTGLNTYTWTQSNTTDLVTRLSYEPPA